MSTIASPRDSSVTGRRLPVISSPTSSSRPSIDSPRNVRSQSESPSRASFPQTRRNRVALREYYNLKREEKADDVESEYSINDQSEVQESELDREGFDADAYVNHVLESQSLEELLKTYNQILTDIRALDAEKKALVYDNYSKLIAATETIHKMRENMDPLNPMTSTLDPAIAQIYERSRAIKSELRESMSPAQRAEADMSDEDKAAAESKKRLAKLVLKVLDTPERVRKLVIEDKIEEARRDWEVSFKLLEKWQAQGVGGPDVQHCIDDGEAALRGEPANQNSWVNIKIR